MKKLQKESLSLGMNYDEDVLVFHLYHFCRRNLTNYSVARNHTTFQNPMNMSSVENLMKFVKAFGFTNCSKRISSETVSNILGNEWLHNKRVSIESEITAFYP